MQIWIDADACPAVIKDIVFRAAERLGIVELLWEVVYADGASVRLEESQMRRVCDELDIPDADRETARAHAFARSGRVAGAGESE